MAGNMQRVLTLVLLIGYAPALAATLVRTEGDALDAEATSLEPVVASTEGSTSILAQVQVGSAGDVVQKITPGVPEKNAMGFTRRETKSTTARVVVSSQGETEGGLVSSEVDISDVKSDTADRKKDAQASVDASAEGASGKAATTGATTGSTYPTTSEADTPRYQWAKVFDGECDGPEIRMYEGGEDGDWKGVEEDRVTQCGEACIDKKTALSGSWTGFKAVGFAVVPTSGRCYCESAFSQNCKRTKNTYVRYDFVSQATRIYSFAKGSDKKIWKCGLEWDGTLDGSEERAAKWDCRPHSDGVHADPVLVEGDCKVACKIYSMAKDKEGVLTKCGLEWHGGELGDGKETKAKWDCKGNADTVSIEGDKIYAHHKDGQKCGFEWGSFIAGKERKAKWDCKGNADAEDGLE